MKNGRFFTKYESNMIYKLKKTKNIILYLENKDIIGMFVHECVRLK